MFNDLEYEIIWYCNLINPNFLSQNPNSWNPQQFCKRLRILAAPLCEEYSDILQPYIPQLKEIPISEFDLISLQQQTLKNFILNFLQKIQQQPYTQNAQDFINTVNELIQQIDKEIQQQYSPQQYNELKKIIIPLIKSQSNTIRIIFSEKITNINKIIRLIYYHLDPVQIHFIPKQTCLYNKIKDQPLDISFTQFFISEIFMSVFLYS